MGNSDDFYKEKAWDMVLDELKSLKKQQDNMAADIQSIKRTISWIFGIAAGITFIINMGWHYIEAKIAGLIHN